MYFAHVCQYLHNKLVKKYVYGWALTGCDMFYIILSYTNDLLNIHCCFVIADLFFSGIDKPLISMSNEIEIF